MNIYEKLLNIQSELKAPKNQKNNFGDYYYRSCEDILEAVKPLCKENKLALTISDEIVMVGQRYYVKATAKLTDIEVEQSSVLTQSTGEIKSEIKGSTICNVAYAREDENKKGLDASQLTGSTSSYARKYALNGLFCIDDTKDADTDAFKKQQDKGNNKPQNTYQKPVQQAPKLISEAQRKRLFAIANGNNEVVKRVLERHRYEKTEQIKVSDYEKICNDIEAEINM